MLTTTSDDPIAPRHRNRPSSEDHRAHAKRFDKFYTCEETAKACIEQLASHITLADDDLFIEPAAGAGVFLQLLPAQRRIGLDIAPDGPDIRIQNFLHWTPPTTEGRTIVIGNPPYGQNGKGARDFVNHAAKFANYIALILPASFKKASVLAQINPLLHIVHQWNVPIDSFTFCDEPRHLNTVFIVFERRSMQRSIIWQEKGHPDFDFVRSAEEAGFAIRRVGRRAGCVIDIADTSGADRGLSHFLFSTD